MQTTGISTCSVAMVTLACLVMEAVGFSIQIQYKNDLTCYTCPAKKDKAACNRWAPDIPCPLNNTVCKTVHRFNRHTGESVQVDKMCAFPDDCNLDTVGCMDTDDNDHIECISCCSSPYCNVDVPYNLTTSLELSVSVFANSARASFAMTSAVMSLMTALLFVAST